MSEAKKGSEPGVYVDEVSGETFGVLSEMYNDFRNWAVSQGEKEIPSAVAWGKRMAQVVPDYKGRLRYRKINGKTERVLMGIGHRADSEF